MKTEDRKYQVFLDYANLSFRDDIENLSRLFTLIKNTYPIGFKPGHFDAIFKRIENLVKYNDPSVVDKFRDLMKEKGKADDPFIRIPFDTAVEAVYGYRNGYCENKCFWREQRRKIIDSALFESANHIKCFECNQLAFVETLKDIVTGKGYDNVKGFHDILAQKKILQQETVITKNNNNLFLKEVFVWRPDMPTGFSGKCSKSAFHDSIRCFVANSLLSFLMNDDRRKLKTCQECKKFYCVKTLHKSKYCSTTCRLAYHNRIRKESGEHARYKREKGYYKY
jgi:hypothetical protein